MTNASTENASASFDYHPVTPDRLSDLRQFSQQHGKFRYCSCMRWRLRSAEFQRSTKAERVAMLEQYVCNSVPVGILAYDADTPIGWCSIAPRDTYNALLGSQTLPPIDDVPVWSVVCFFVDRKYRRRKLSRGLLRAAVEYALSQGAPSVEGYPVPAEAPSYTFMGTPSTFLQAGFIDVTPSERKRRVMRYSNSHLG